MRDAMNQTAQIGVYSGHVTGTCHRHGSAWPLPNIPVPQANMATVIGLGDFAKTSGNNTLTFQRRLA
jgi:hypothetical protein